MFALLCVSPLPSPPRCAGKQNRFSFLLKLHNVNLLSLRLLKETENPAADATGRIVALGRIVLANAGRARNPNPWEILPLDGSKSVHGVANLSFWGAWKTNLPSKTRRQSARGWTPLAKTLLHPLSMARLYEDHLSSGEPRREAVGSCRLVCALLFFSFFSPPASITRNRRDWRRRAGEGSLRWERQLDRRSWHLGVRQQLFFAPAKNKRRNTLNGRRRPPRTVETGLLRNIWRAIRENESFNEENNTR